MTLQINLFTISASIQLYHFYYFLLFSFYLSICRFLYFSYFSPFLLLSLSLSLPSISQSLVLLPFISLPPLRSFLLSFSAPAPHLSIPLPLPSPLSVFLRLPRSPTLPRARSLLLNLFLARNIYLFLYLSFTEHLSQPFAVPFSYRRR